MDPSKLTYDARLRAWCMYCGGAPDTDDHVPSKVLLDQPYPNNLPLVPACLACNNGLSSDEEYLACLLDCVIAGSTDPNSLTREKARRSLVRHPALAARIEQAKTTDASGRLVWVPEADRIKRVMLKLARGHAAYEITEPQFAAPAHVSFGPLTSMEEHQRHQFENPPGERLWPEVGSRAFERMALAFAMGGPAGLTNGWQVVQPGRYRYLVSYSEGVDVRMVLSEYLACQVIW